MIPFLCFSFESFWVTILLDLNHSMLMSTMQRLAPCPLCVHTLKTFVFIVGRFTKEQKQTFFILSPRRTKTYTAILKISVSTCGL